MYEYIVTAFKVVVGVVTNDRLAIAAAVAIGVMLIWVTLSLIFSFQARFASGVRKINNYVSRNGIHGDAKDGLSKLISKMPTEFQRGYKSFERNPNSLPSENIKRFESLDVELSGGVFNQNKSVLKTYMNFVFVTLLLFSFAILQDSSLTGYLIAEAFITPAIFLLVSKVIYYVYTAVRQNQYKTAVEDFNDMLDNLDKAAADASGDIRSDVSYIENNKEETAATIEPVIYADVNNEEEKINTEEVVEDVYNEELEDNASNEIAEGEVYTKEKEETNIVSDDVSEPVSFEEKNEMADEPDLSEEKIAEIYKEFGVEGVIQEQTEEQQEIPSEDADLDEIAAIREYRAFVERAQKEAEENGDVVKSSEEEIKESSGELIEEKEDVVSEEEFFDNNQELNEESEEFVDIEETINEFKKEEPIEDQNTFEDYMGRENFESLLKEENEDLEKTENKEQSKQKNGIVDNFKPDFSGLLEEEEIVEVKRGRGRPRKEVREDGEFVIKNDKEFEEALVRAEKLMRKNEEPLSASQTKRIERQIKELVDAMTKYKEGK